MTKTIKLYKPLSAVELGGVIRSGWREFSAACPQQRWFYPKLYCAYAEGLARQWDAVQFGAGYVVAMELPLAFMLRYPISSVAYEAQREYQVPVAELPLLNRNILGRIYVVSRFTRQPLVGVPLVHPLASCDGDSPRLAAIGEG